MEKAIKRALRVTTPMLNDEILDNIEAAKADMRRLGIDTESDNKLIQKAAELYCKWQFDFQGKGEQFMKCYKEMVDSMRLSTLDEELPEGECDE